MKIAAYTLGEKAAFFLPSWGGMSGYAGPKTGLGIEGGYTYAGGLVPYPYAGIRAGGKNLGVSAGLPYIGVDTGVQKGWHASRPRSLYKLIGDKMRGKKDGISDEDLKNILAALNESSEKEPETTEGEVMDKTSQLQAAYDAGATEVFQKAALKVPFTGDVGSPTTAAPEPNKLEAIKKLLGQKFEGLKDVLGGDGVQLGAGVGAGVGIPAGMLHGLLSKKKDEEESRLGKVMKGGLTGGLGGMVAGGAAGAATDMTANNYLASR